MTCRDCGIGRREYGGLWHAVWTLCHCCYQRRWRKARARGWAVSVAMAREEVA